MDSRFTFASRDNAEVAAERIGCSGVHSHGDVWMPCETHEQFQSAISNMEKSKRRRKRRGGSGKVPSGYERLIERGVRSIESLPGGGIVSGQISQKAGRRRARSDRLAATPAPAEDRIVGSSRNKPGTASSSSAAKGIEISAATVEALKTKLRAHNAEAGANGKTSLTALKAVYRRGAGAFSVSHRPGMSRGQWAMGRVNAFLEILRRGKPKNARYVNDNDLLPRNHPWRKRLKELVDEEFEVKGNVRKANRLGGKLGVRRVAKDEKPQP